MKTYYKNALPHINPRGTQFFVTFRLEGSIPKSKLKEWEDQYHNKCNEIESIEDEKERNTKMFDHRKRSFVIYDDLLESINSGPHYLKEKEVLEIIKEQLHRFDGDLYDLIAYSIMSNHVHILVDTSQIVLSEEIEAKVYDNHSELSYILKRVKGASASFANKKLKRKGRFWHKENYDIYIRNEKMLKNVIGYILDNPVKASLVKTWEDYPGNYLMS